MYYKVGIDIGSTTIKVVVINDNGELVFSCYRRHLSRIAEKLSEILQELTLLLNNKSLKVAVTGSAGMSLAEAGGIPFVQEVYALAGAVDELEPDADVVIELGGEDAKILFLTGGVEERMNGTCAGGTGAFIDQMATLLNVSVEELDALSLQHKKIYPIASRCGVFAKTDIQPLINQGAAKADIAASIFQAVAEQTVTGLAQGRNISGKILFLGGPLYFNQGLRDRFTDMLQLTPENAVFPELGQYFVALGAAVYADGTERTFSYQELKETLQNQKNITGKSRFLPPLFNNEDEYAQFIDRHSKNCVPLADTANYRGGAYLGIDVGSTTSKLALVSENGNLLYTFYASNRGNPLPIIKEQLLEIYRLLGDRIHLVAGAVTGYGEELIQNAFNIDYGLVETVAHFTAAHFFDPKVDYIIDIGGQDMKCFTIRNNTIDSIVLNEACSSGCGSFIQSFAEALGYAPAEFAKLALFAERPVDLGSRCTVFMNSSVKQAQRDGAGVGDVSAGLAISVVKNAIYKVLRVHSAQELGQHIVVQGGTFLNDAVLRSFERELGYDVIRPNIAGLMGAFGAALYARDRHKAAGKTESTIMSADEVAAFHHQARPVTCQGCANHCSMTVNIFPNGRRFISGNKCERGLGGKANDLPNVYEYTLNKFRALQQQAEAEFDPARHTVGIPLVLNMYENLPFWYTFFRELGCNVVISGESSRSLYAEGQFTIPSDTVCYPAKLAHGHIQRLLNKGVKTIFYPCSSYNVDEGKSDKNYNCPVVAYYPELLNVNVTALREIDFLYPYLSMNDRQLLAYHFHTLAQKHPHFNFTLAQCVNAANAAWTAYRGWWADVEAYGISALKTAEEHGHKVVVLAGRPYHLDREINHSIDKMFNSLGFVVISERVLTNLAYQQKVNVLNQWTFHARMYNAARYVCRHPNMQMVQLVSFGCGLDAITADELKDILERNGKIYTQLKIDEINNLAAVKIRARSLLAAMEAGQSSN
ncbi:MAG: 2-hydroxyacyl-CoA dehydratase [Firmicutes bacterium]|nr:2-hydroxyacyl-CoA dehydratase [Bacillota bacterium]